MENLKEQIEKELRKLENMIEQKESAIKIREQKEKLDSLLEKYASDI